MTAFTIRHAEPEDYDSVIPVVNDWWGGRKMADMLPRLFFVHFRETSFAVEAEGRVVGFLVGFRSQTYPEQAYIHFVGVDPAWRRSGIARALYHRFFQAVRPLGCSEVNGVTSPANERSIAFHTSMGFEVLPGYGDGPGQARVRLRKRI